MPTENFLAHYASVHAIWGNSDSPWAGHFIWEADALKACIEYLENKSNLELVDFFTVLIEGQAFSTTIVEDNSDIINVRAFCDALSLPLLNFFGQGWCDEVDVEKVRNLLFLEYPEVVTAAVDVFKALLFQQLISFKREYCTSCRGEHYLLDRYSIRNRVGGMLVGHCASCNTFTLASDTGITLSDVGNQLYNLAKDDEETRIGHADNTLGLVCQDCYGNNSVIECYQCGVSILRIEAYVLVSNDRVCEECYYESTTYCTTCSAEIEHGEILCEDCEAGKAIKEYSYYPEFLFHDVSKDGFFSSYEYELVPKKKIEAKLFMGIELEVEMRNNKYNLRNETASRYVECVPDTVGYLKHDSSLDTGFEIVSHPGTLAYWQHPDNPYIQGLDLVIENCKSYNTHSCGIHIHINRTAFRPLHLLKFYKFFMINKQFIEVIAERRDSTYANFHSAKNSVSSVLQYKKRNFSGDKYDAVNLSHSNTIEVRVFKGNLVKERILKNFEFIAALHQWTYIVSPERIKIGSYQDFTSWVARNRKSYPNLFSFIMDRKSQINEVVSSEDETNEDIPSLNDINLYNNRIYGGARPPLPRYELSSEEIGTIDEINRSVNSVAPIGARPSFWFDSEPAILIPEPTHSIDL